MRNAYGRDELWPSRTGFRNYRSPGQGEFYLTRYPTQGGNFEAVTLAPNSAQEAMAMVVEAFIFGKTAECP